MTDSNGRPVSPVNGQPLPEGRRFEPGDRAREIGRKGGKNSKAKQKMRKTLREELLALLSEQITDKNSGRQMEAQRAMSTALIQQALRGNVKAFEIVRDTIGEKPVDNISISATDMSALDEAFDKATGGSE